MARGLYLVYGVKRTPWEEITFKLRKKERIGASSSWDSKESACNTGDPGSIPGLGTPWKRGWQPTPVFLSGESYEQGNLVGYSPWGHKESDTNEWLTQLQRKVKQQRGESIRHTLQTYQESTDQRHRKKPCRAVSGVGVWRLSVGLGGWPWGA